MAFSCPQCGKPLYPGGQFCGYCGTPVASAGSTVKPAAAARPVARPAAPRPAAQRPSLPSWVFILAGLAIGLLVCFAFVYVVTHGKPLDLMSYIFPMPAPAPTPTAIPYSAAVPDPDTVPAKAKPEPTATPVITDPSPRFSNFYACPVPCSGDPSQGTRTFAPKTRYIYLNYDYKNLPQNAHYVRTWTVKGRGEWVRYDCAWQSASNGHESDLKLWDLEGLTSGDWTITITIDDLVVLQESLTVLGDWGLWTPAGVFNACYGRR